MIGPVAFHDLLAGVVTMVLLVGTIMLVALQREVPPFLTAGVSVAFGYAFRGGVQLQNELRHRNRSNNES